MQKNRGLSTLCTYRATFFNAEKILTYISDDSAKPSFHKILRSDKLKDSNPLPKVESCRKNKLNKTKLYAFDPTIKDELFLWYDTNFLIRRGEKTLSSLLEMVDK